MLRKVKQTIIYKSSVTNGKIQWKEEDILFSSLFFPKATNLTKMAGLLTYSLLTTFPFLARETVVNDW